MVYVIIAIVALVAVVLAVQYWYLSLMLVIAVLAPRVIRVIRKRAYFNSQVFLDHKKEIQSVITEHNEVSDYVNEIRENGKFSIGFTESGSHSHLAQSMNTSKFGYKRDRNVADFSPSHIHKASLQVVRNSSVEPIKYLIKYFDIDATEEKLSEIEAVGESISKLENAVENLRFREESISTSISPPKFILKYYLKEFQSQIGLSIPALQIPYPKYVFQYVSAGGNSSQKTEIKLNSPTIDSLIESLSAKIKFNKSAAGQRALMTASFREFIKKRDGYCCQICSISLNDEAHLLLEVDHIKPVSKGGLSIETNLQTLCWKCNRSKSNKDFSS